MLVAGFTICLSAEFCSGKTSDSDKSLLSDYSGYMGRQLAHTACFRNRNSMGASNLDLTCVWQLVTERPYMLHWLTYRAVSVILRLAGLLALDYPGLHGSHTSSSLTAQSNGSQWLSMALKCSFAIVNAHRRRQRERERAMALACYGPGPFGCFCRRFTAKVHISAHFSAWAAKLMSSQLLICNGPSISERFGGLHIYLSS